MHSVLIVDDEQKIREILSRWLQAEGYGVREAANAEAALEFMVLAAADVVVCDVEMPGHGGLWLTAQMKTRFPHTPVILATAVDSIPPGTTLQSGISDYLVKPFARTVVVNAVRLAVEWHVASLAKPPANRDDAGAVEAWLDKDTENV